MLSGKHSAAHWWTIYDVVHGDGPWRERLLGEIRRALRGETFAAIAVTGSCGVLVDPQSREEFFGESIAEHYSLSPSTFELQGGLAADHPVQIYVRRSMPDVESIP